jgi:hypothetical protein
VLGRLWGGIVFFGYYLGNIFFLACESLLQFILRVDDVWVFRWHSHPRHTDVRRTPAGSRIARPPLHTFMFGRW